MGEWDVGSQEQAFSRIAELEAEIKRQRDRAEKAEAALERELSAKIFALETRLSKLRQARRLMVEADVAVADVVDLTEPEPNAPVSRKAT